MTTQHDALAAISERKIITTHVHPPIPYRGNDWSAYFDDEGAEAGRYGWGATEAEAIDDLRMQYDPTYSEPCSDCAQINNKWCCTMNCYPRGKNLGIAYGL